MALVESDVALMQERSNFTSLIIGNWKRNGSKALRNTPSGAMFPKPAWKFGVTHMHEHGDMRSVYPRLARASFLRQHAKHSEESLSLSYGETVVVRKSYRD